MSEKKEIFIEESNGNVGIFLKSCEEIKFQETSSHEYGGKGFHLLEMKMDQKSKFQVPQFFLISTKIFEWFLESNSLVTLIIKDLSKLVTKEKKFDKKNLNLIKTVSTAIRERFRDFQFPKKFHEEISSKLQFSKTSYAVRSSCSQEDMSDLSFAGQYETFLNVKTCEEIAKSIIGCYSSIFSARALQYRVINGLMDSFLDPNFKEENWRNIIPLMSVVVQEMINGRASGVIFTMNMETDSREHITINSCYGIGEGLVSGVVENDSYVVNKKDKSVIKRTIGEKKNMYVYSNDKGGIELVKISDDKAKLSTLSDEEIVKLCEYSNEIEQYYVTPQDIEFTIDQKGQIFILQSRAVTTTLPPLAPVDHKFILGKKTFNEIEYLKRNEELFASHNSSSKYQRMFINFGPSQQMLAPFRPLGLSNFSMWLSALQAEKYLKSANVGGFWYISLDQLWAPLSLEADLLENSDLDVAQARLMAKIVKSKEFKKNRPRDMTCCCMMDLLKVAKDFVCSVSLGYIEVGCGLCTRRNIEKYEERNEQRVKDVSSKLEKFLDNKKIFSKEKRNVLDEVEYGLKYLKQKKIFDMDILKLTFREIGMLMPSMSVIPDLEKLIGEQNLTGKVLGGVESNITSKMTLMMADMADNHVRNSKSILEKLENFSSSHSSYDIYKVYSAFDVENNEEERDFVNELKKFMALFGERGIHEIDITNKTFENDPSFIINNILLNVKGEKGATRKRFKEVQKRVEVEIKKLMNKITRKKCSTCFCNVLSCGIFGCCVKKSIYDARHATGIREHPKYYIIKAFRVLYKTTERVLGQILFNNKFISDVSDVKWLTYNEIHDILMNVKKNIWKKENEKKVIHPSYIRGVIEYRKNIHKKTSKMDSPILVNQHMESYEKIELMKEIEESNLFFSKEKGNDNIVYGIPTSGGTYKGKVRKINSPNQVNEIEEGEILVTKATDPSFTLCFANISGLITSLGGPMCHGATVARELGIPALIIMDCMKRYDTGDLIQIDGTTGKVELIEKNMKKENNDVKKVNVEDEEKKGMEESKNEVYEGKTEMEDKTLVEEIEIKEEK